PDLICAGHALGVDFGPADDIRHVLWTNGDCLRCAVGDLARDFATQLADLTLELADTRLARVAGDDLAQRPIRDRQLARAQTVLGQLARHERSEEHTSELQSRSDLVCRLLLEKKKQKKY